MAQNHCLDVPTVSDGSTGVFDQRPRLQFCDDVFRARTFICNLFFRPFQLDGIVIEGTSGTPLKVAAPL